MDENKATLGKLIWFIVGGAVIAGMSFIPPAPPLGPKAMVALGILCGAIVWMVSGAVQDYVAITIMSILWVVTGCAKMEVVYGAFATSNWWLLVGALGLAVPAAKSGLLRRLSLYIMRMFPPSFKGQSFAMVFIGTFLGLLIPSTAAKAAIIGQVCKGVNDALGFKDRSRASAGLFAVFLNSNMVMAPGFLSASFVGYTCLGLFPESVEKLSWVAWFVAALPWTIIALVLMTGAALIMYRPKQESAMTKDYVNEEIKSMGAWNKSEKYTCVILAICLLMWVTERMHGISSAMVACGGMTALLALRLYDRKDFRAAIAWDSVVFIGVIMGMAGVLNGVGVNDLIREILGPVLQPLMGNVWLFVPVYCLVFMLIRFLVASLVSSITICSLVLVPIAMTMGIHPFVTIFIAYTCSAVWFTPYQNSIYFTAQIATGNYAMSSHRQMIPYGLVYAVVMIIGNMACIPWWKMLGYLP
ncbi:MAG: anion permease [Lachnospiraceae bacterium]|jgi:DASS family divalent anion:Na+ symporter|nr:anion permease [Lachnospiraceae bacterium]